MIGEDDVDGMLVGDMSEPGVMNGEDDDVDVLCVEDMDSYE